jgi:hypothetical protein
MRILTALAIAVLFAVPALAECPPDCVGGGGPAATDCFVAWSGISSTAVTCTDGDVACDTDGVANGVCALGLQGCINVPLSGCAPGTLTGPPSVKPAGNPVAQALAAALAGLDPAATGCTAPGVPLPLKISLAGIKAGKAKLTVSASSGGSRDKDKLKLTCLPSTGAPSFANQLQPIFGTSPTDASSKCAYSGCHSGTPPPNPPNLEPGRAYGELVNVRALPPAKFVRVKPGSIKKSYLARKILGQGMARGTVMMPQGCPSAPLAPGGCLSDQEIFTILSWIANGAPDN